ncbi:hypothetical protein JCM10212_006475 [Sporobolomyces blumeae]
MAPSTADFEQGIIELLTTLAPGCDPFAALATYLDDLILPARDRGAVIQLEVLSAVFALMTVLAIVSLVIRWRKGILWIARTSPTGLVRPHFSASWTVPALAFLILLQPAMYYERQVFERDGRSDFMYWLSLPWLALAWSGLIATWAILASHVQQLQSRGRWSSPLVPIAVNAFGFGSLVAFTALLVPPAVLVGREYSSLLDRLSDARVVLAASSVNHDPSKVPNFEGAIASLEKLGSEALAYFTSIKILFGIFAASSLLFAIIMAVPAYCYLTFLRHEMRSIESASNIGGSFVSNSTSSRRKLQRSWNTILITVVVNLIVASILAANSLVVAIEPSHLAQRHRLQIALLLPLYSVASFGLVTTCLLLHRAVQAAPSDDKLYLAAVRVAGDARRLESGRKGTGNARDSEEQTMVDTFDGGECAPDGKEGGNKVDPGGSRRSSWFGGGARGGASRRTSMAIPAHVVVDIEVVVQDDVASMASGPRG